MPSRPVRHAFTLVEFLVLISIVLVLLSIFIPYAMTIREADRRTRCQRNLIVLRNALVQYREMNGIYPRTVYDAANKPNGYTAYTGPDAPDPFAADSAVKANDVTASLWLLMRTGLVTDTNYFICPSTGDRRDPISNAAGQFVKANARSNFRKPENLSYSYATPFGNAAGYTLNDERKAGFILLADKNPGVDPPTDDVTAPGHDATPAAFAQANSHNHGRAGQNVLTVQGSVDFDYTPYCGVGRLKAQRNSNWQEFGDNIYTALAAVPLVDPNQKIPFNANGVCGPTFGPAWDSDSYLVPTAHDMPPK